MLFNDELKRHYGIYRGICKGVDDKNRVQVSIPQLLGTQLPWADPCLPVTNDATHANHIAHTAAAVAALLNTHSISGSTGSGGGLDPHSHSFSASASHSGTGGPLTHEHVATGNPLDVSTSEHSPHRSVPNLNQGVWVMFEGGDINFPVWIGVY